LPFHQVSESEDDEPSVASPEVPKQEDLKSPQGPPCKVPEIPKPQKGKERIISMCLNSLILKRNLIIINDESRFYLPRFPSISLINKLHWWYNG
jgi:hypothetical protein